MNGSCPNCRRSYDVSAEFLAMGGKAKCPHCLLDLEFTPTHERLDPRLDATRIKKRTDLTRPDPNRESTSVPSGKYRDTGFANFQEIDGCCPRCNRHYKISLEFINAGGHARCPHCSQNLTMETPSDQNLNPATQIDQGVSPSTDGEGWAGTMKIQLPELEQYNFAANNEVVPANSHPGSPPDYQDTFIHGETLAEPQDAVSDASLEGRADTDKIAISNIPIKRALQDTRIVSSVELDLGEEPVESPGGPMSIFREETRVADQSSLAAAISDEDVDLGRQPVLQDSMPSYQDTKIQNSADSLLGQPESEGETELALDQEPGEEAVAFDPAVPASYNEEEEKQQSVGVDEPASELPDLSEDSADVSLEYSSGLRGEETHRVTEEQQSPEAFAVDDTHPQRRLNSFPEQTSNLSEADAAGSEEGSTKAERDNAPAYQDTDPGITAGALDEQVSDLGPSEEEVLADQVAPPEDVKSDDWATAAARWAERGFKADEMPAFVRADSTQKTPPPPSDREISKTTEGCNAAYDQAAAGGLSFESLFSGASVVSKPTASRSVSGPATLELVEVSDSDIIEVTEGETRTAPVSISKKPRTEPVLSKKPISAQSTAQPGKTKRSLLRSPMVVIAALMLVAVAVVGLVWMFWDASGEIRQSVFPSEGVKATVMEAPEPESISAKEEAIKHYGLGNQLAYQGKLEEAIVEYQQALRLDPSFPHPHRAMGAIFAALQKPNLAANSYSTYLKLAPTTPDADKVREILRRYQPGKP